MAALHCVYCGASGFGPPGAWPTVRMCPVCGDSPQRRAWFAELQAIGRAMHYEAEQRGLSAHQVVVTPEIRERFAALGPQPA